METKQFKTNIMCGSCIAKVTPLLNETFGEKNWEVSLSVVAQQDAYIGDIVNLKHPKTNTTLVGQVTGQGEVELR